MLCKYCIYGKNGLKYLARIKMPNKILLIISLKDLSFALHFKMCHVCLIHLKDDVYVAFILYLNVLCYNFFNFHEDS